jgi:3-methyladenine DNA glycosylase Tag
MQQPPAQIDVRTLSDYLGAMTRAVFQPGLNWHVVDAKWPGITEAFLGFDPTTVAGYTPADVERLMADPRMIRNRRKIEAVIANAGEMLVLEREYGSFPAYLHSFGSYEATVADLKKRFHFLGDSGGYYFLYVVGERVPEHEEWMAGHAFAHRR